MTQLQKRKYCVYSYYQHASSTMGCTTAKWLTIRLGVPMARLVLVASWSQKVPNILQGSAATQPRCGGIFSGDYVASLLPSLTIIQFHKSYRIYRKFITRKMAALQQKSQVIFRIFMTHCIYRSCVRGKLVTFCMVELCAAIELRYYAPVR